jgi:hypothetical protein
VLGAAPVTYDVFLSSVSTLVVAIIGLAVALARTREKLTRLEEWIRLHEDGKRKS